jgi:long-subunit acyl-CoA synthetase (AMP-forming)
VALRTPGDGLAIGFDDYAERVERIAGGLAALSVDHGDTVALMLVNRPEFNLVDTAAPTSARSHSRSTTPRPPSRSSTCSPTPRTRSRSPSAPSSP